VVALRGVELYPPKNTFIFKEPKMWRFQILLLLVKWISMGNEVTPRSEGIIINIYSFYNTPSSHRELSG
jgi:hypothetical protein